MGAVAAKGEGGGGDRLVRADAVSLDAGDLDEARDGVAGHPEVVLESDLGRVLDLGGRPVEDGAKTGGGHRGGGADLRLAAGVRARDRRVVLDEPPDSGGGEQELGDAVIVAADAMVEVVADDGRDDAGRAVGRGGDHLAPARVLLVDGHRVDVEPVGDHVRLRPVGPLLAA